MEWKVVRSGNPDLEREHLNKILADIRKAVDNITGGAVLSPAQEGRLREVITRVVSVGGGGGAVAGSFTITLSGDATGQGVVQNLRSTTIPVVVSNVDGVAVTGTLNPSVVPAQAVLQYQEGLSIRYEQIVNPPPELLSSDQLPEGVLNLYFTPDRLFESIQAGDGIETYFDEDTIQTGIRATGAAVITLPAGETIFGGRVVRAVGGEVFTVDNTDDTHGAQVVGVALESVTTISDPVRIQVRGPLTDLAWTWADGVIYCAANGQLTQTAPATGWFLEVARVLAPTQIDIDLEPVIYR